MPKRIMIKSFHLGHFFIISILYPNYFVIKIDIFWYIQLTIFFPLLRIDSPTCSDQKKYFICLVVAKYAESWKRTNSGLAFIYNSRCWKCRCKTIAWRKISVLAKPKWYFGTKNCKIAKNTSLTLIRTIKSLK